MTTTTTASEVATHAAPAGYECPICMKASEVTGSHPDVPSLCEGPWCPACVAEELAEVKASVFYPAEEE